jgi:PAS domain S-box-containing protein
MQPDHCQPEIMSRLNIPRSIRHELGDRLFWDTPVGIVCETADGGILMANPAFCRMTGYSDKQLRHLDRKAIAHPEDFEIELDTIAHMVREGVKSQALRKRYIHHNGGTVSCDIEVHLVGEPLEESYLLSFVRDRGERAIVERELQQHREREILLDELSATIRATFDLTKILDLGVNRLREALGGHRVLAYQFSADGRAVCRAENVDPAYASVREQVLTLPRIDPSEFKDYRSGRVWSIDDLDYANLPATYLDRLKPFQVRSIMAVGIPHSEKPVLSGLDGDRLPLAGDRPAFPLWGLLVVHHCHAPRRWLDEERQLLETVSDRLAIAIQQAELVEGLQNYACQLERRVNERTESLARSLKFEQLIRHLTESLHHARDEDSVLDAAVEGLVDTLGARCCFASLFDPQAEIFEIRSLHGHDLQERDPQLGQRFPLDHWPASCREHLLNGEICFHDLFSPVATRKPVTESELDTGLLQTICPIVSNGDTIGVLGLSYDEAIAWSAPELQLLEQVAVQCAIAIRQARLLREEQSLRLSAQYFRSFIEQSKEVFAEYDDRGRYLSINPAGSVLFGFPLDRIVGHTNRELLGETGEIFDRAIAQVLTTGEPLVTTLELDLGSETKTFETVCSPISEPDGYIHRAIAIAQDISDIRQQWRLLQQQNQELAAINRLKEEFIATTSHELRTPLTAILGFSSVLLEESFGSLNDKQKIYVERMHTSGQHLLELINDILDLSRIEADRLELEPQLVFVHDICEGVISLVQERITNHGLQLEVEVTPEIESVVVDPRRLKQMLLNLLSNAIKFTPEGSVGLKIDRVWRERYSSSDGRSRELHKQERVEFTVWDTGIGIDERDRPRLFSPFSQIDSSLARQYQGTGLGLAITRKLAELHGGEIFVETQPERGSLFTISLPLEIFPPVSMAAESPS